MNNTKQQIIRGRKALQKQVNNLLKKAEKDYNVTIVVYGGSSLGDVPIFKKEKHLGILFIGELPDPAAQKAQIRFPVRLRKLQKQ